MSKKSPIGLRAGVVASHRTIHRRLAGMSARTRQASSRIRDLLSACSAGASPDASLRAEIEPLEVRQMLSGTTTVYASTSAPAASNQNVWDGVTAANGGGVELGAKFTSDVSGSITGVRFYKSSMDTSPHTGEVWNSSGTLLATAAFTNETASGWQEADFSTPVAVTAGQVYVISYHTDSEYMSFTPNGLASELSNGSVHLLANGASGVDGVFSYGANSVFPTQDYEAGSYWVDAAFAPSTASTSVSTVYASTTVPAASDQNVWDGVTAADGGGVELGAKFTSDVSGSITGIRFYKGSQDTGPHTGEVWSSSGTLLATATFTNETASGWQEADFSSPVAVTAGQVYVISYHTDAQYMAFTANGLASEMSNGPLHLLANGADGVDGVFSYGANSVFPTQDYEAGSYWVDAVFSSNSTAASTTASSVYAATSAPDASGMNIGDGVTSANGGVELGAKFTSDNNGYISGVRFYKTSLQTGPNTGEVWNSSGTLLATATFTNETASGWQQVNFSNPVSVSAGQVYIVSFHTDSQYMAFTAGGLSSELSNGPLHLLANGTDGADGVYSYGANSVFPTTGYLAGSYWVDAVFSTTATAVPPSPPVSPTSPASPPPTAIQSPYGPTASISIQGAGGEAGDSVFVNGLSSSLGDGTQLTAAYSWNFGDPNGQYNNLTGWNAGHIYDNPGTYTITLTVTNDLGLSSTATSQVTVTPDTRTTIYVNTNGNDANSGLSASAPIASEARLAQVLSSYNNSNVTVLFACGQTFDMPYYLYVEGSNETFSSYGSGAAPVIYKVTSPTGDDGVFYMTASANQIIIENLTFDSPNAAPVTDAPEISATAIYPNGTNITVRNNTFLNLEDAMDCYQGPNGILVENNSAPLLTGIRGYFVWMNGYNGVVLGNTVVNSTRQHVMRSNYTTTADWLIAGNNFASGDNPSDPGEAIKTTIYLRLGEDFYITDNTLSDAPVEFGPTDDMPTTATVSWIKLDGNTIDNCQVILHGSVQYMMISNNLTNLSGIYAQYLITPTDDMGRQMLDVTMEHNTGVATGTLATFLDIEGDAPYGALTVENNLFADPSMIPGSYMAASVFIAGSNADAVALFSHNVWVAASSQFTGYPGGVNYIAPAGVLETNYYLTASQWNSLPNVQDDYFETVNPPTGSDLQVAVSGGYAGAILPAPL